MQLGLFPLWASVVRPCNLQLGPFLRINAVFQNAEGQNWEVQKTNIAKKVWNLIKEKQQKQTGKKEGKEGRR